MTKAMIPTTATQLAPQQTPRDSKGTRCLNITVLAGGPGAERDVSLQSGRAVYDALKRLGHRVLLQDVTPDDLSALEVPADIVFIALHGEFGEDGSVQAELDRRGIPYTGSGAAASQRAFDKVRSKESFVQSSLPTPEFEVVDGTNLTGIEKRFAVPAVVKPVASGSSVDTSIVRSTADLASATAMLVGKYGRALVERYIRGPELTVGIVGDEAMPVCEIRTSREFYDYQAKYIDDDTVYLFDLDLPAGFVRRVQTLGLDAHRALGCSVFSRVDVMVDEERQEPYLLEINTIPGFTAHSLLPKAAARFGWSFDELCRRIVEMSLS